MPIYTVTFCNMEQEAGANPLWHSCLLLSRLLDNDKKMEIIGNWGFYATPATKSDSYSHRFKMKFGLDVDFHDNHGMLQHEELRFLDLGRGLNGVTFELSEEKFNALQEKCLQVEKDQVQAINEIAEPLDIRGDGRKMRHYPQEHLAKHIYALEKERAKQQGRPSRLLPFEFNFSRVNTCKFQMLRLLEGILAPEEIQELAGWHPAIPRLSGGGAEQIHLHSTGPLCQHRKRSGEVIYFRQWGDEDVRLFWTLLPQTVRNQSEECLKSFKMHDEYTDEVKKVIRRLQALEWLFINASLPDLFSTVRERLINTFQTYYEVFSGPGAGSEKLPDKGHAATWMRIFSLPECENEAKLMKSLSDAKYLFNCLYLAMVDGWSLDDEAVSDKIKLDALHPVDLAALAALLPADRKKEICRIIGRNYLEPENWLSEEEESRAALSPARACR